jgi:hypothetical protein
VPSPFPGMDPYLEGYLWPDVHSALAHTIRQQLAPQIQPKYVARLEISVIEDQSPAAEIGIMYPDVEVGFDHGVGHPLLLLYDAKVSLGKNSNYFNGLWYDLSNPFISLF